MRRIHIIGGGDPEAHQIVAKWVMDRVPDESIQNVHELGPYMAYGILRDKEPVAGVIFNWYREMENGNDMRAIIAADHPSWCLPGVLAYLFRYPFLVAGCTRLTCVIREGNTRSEALCKGLGFRKEGVFRRGYNGKSNALVYGMLKEECRWLQPRPRGARSRVSDPKPVQLNRHKANGRQTPH